MVADDGNQQWLVVVGGGSQWQSVVDSVGRWQRTMVDDGGGQLSRSMVKELIDMK